MPKIKKKRHEQKTRENEDVVIKAGNIRIYFQNYYTIISLVNDVLLGVLFFIGSIASVFNGPDWIREWSYFIGALFMLMRPTLKILRNIFIYNKEEFQEKVTDPNLLGKKDKKEKPNEENLHNYDEDIYEESKNRKEKMKEIEKQENKNNDKN